jgi:quinolinate synthase
MAEDPDKRTDAKIEELRKKHGRRLLILGHYYQRDTVLRHADIKGDSLELSRNAAAHPEAERIVLCGVRFMAESAAIIAAPSQEVYLPAAEAGCPMADMATAEDAARAMDNLGRMGGRWIPVVYVNSSADVKAWCGRNGGSTCTSSNARRVMEWAMGQGGKVLFLPDEHLGWNTAHDMGIPDDEIRVYDPRRDNGGLEPEDVRSAKIVVWKGFCLIHTRFTAAQVKTIRSSMPGAKIIVHPETPREVVRLADAHGSTSQIIEYVGAAPAGSTVVIGTEVNLVERLAAEHAGRVTVKALSQSVCANMAKTNEAALLRVLETWPRDAVVRVSGDVARDARAALDRMLASS